MQAKGRFISTLLVINAFLGGYAFGFNSRHVLVIDPSLPPLKIEKKAVETKTETPAKFDKVVEKKDSEPGKKKHAKHHKIKEETSADESKTKHKKKRHKESSN